MGRAGDSRAAHPVQVVPRHNVAVEPEARHQGKPLLAGHAQVDPRRPLRLDDVRETRRSFVQSEMSGEEVLGTRGKDGDRVRKGVR